LQSPSDLLLLLKELRDSIQVIIGEPLNVACQSPIHTITTGYQLPIRALIERTIADRPLVDLTHTHTSVSVSRSQVYKPEEIFVREVEKILEKLL
jgi:hypothetical protein